MKKTIFTIFICVITFNMLNAQSAAWTQTANPVLTQVNGVAFSSDGQKIISGTECTPAVIRHYNVANGNITWDYTVGGSFMCIMGVGFSSNGKYFSAVEEMGNVLVFDNVPAVPVLTSTISMGTSAAFAIDFAPNNYKMVVGGSNGKLQTYVVANGSLNLNVSAHGAYVTAVNYSPDNKKIASGGSDGLAKIWDTTGLLLHTLTTHTGGITSVKFTKDNTKLITTSSDYNIKIWSVATGSLLQTINTGTFGVIGVDVSLDNARFVTISGDKQIRIYNLNSYVLEGTFGLLNAGNPTSVAWSQTNINKIAVGYTGGTVTLYDMGGALAINENALNKVNLEAFPNPFIDSFKLQFSINSLKSISVSDIHGKVLFNYPNLENKSEVIINGINLKPENVYFVNCITDNNTVLIKKIIKTH